MPAEDFALNSAASSSLSFFRRFCDHSCVRHRHHQTNIRAPPRDPVSHPTPQQSITSSHLHCLRLLQLLQQEKAVRDSSFYNVS